MQDVDSFLHVLACTRLPSYRPPGCPRIPMPPCREDATPQQRWDRGLRNRASEPDMLSVAQTASLTQLTGDAIDSLVRTERAIALVDADGTHRLPYWQFFDPPWTDLPLMNLSRVLDYASFGDQ